MQVASLLDPRLRPRGGAADARPEVGARCASPWALEHAWSKDQILEAYLNLVDFRGELAGVGAAAAALFGTTPDALTAAEARCWPRWLPRPARRRRRSSRRVTALRSRVPERIAADAVEAAARRALAGVPAHAVAALARAARRAAAARRPRRCVRTTLDAGVQRAAAAALRPQPARRARAWRRRTAPCWSPTTPAGDVLAYVGSSGVSRARAHVDGVRARRQAGSTLKPFLYGLAIERRLLTPAALLEDAPLEIAVPADSTGRTTTTSTSAAWSRCAPRWPSSLNMPAVRTLELVGGDAFVGPAPRASASRASTGRRTTTGPSLALGSRRRQPVGAGRRLPRARQRRAVDAAPPAPRRPAGRGAPRRSTPATAFLVADVLADRESRSATFGLENALATRFWTAVKTGTSKDMRDNWCVGFSRRYTVGVWVGNFSGAPMHDVSGVTGAAPVWLEVMERLHRDVPSDAPAPPPGVVAVPVAFPGDVEPPRREWMLAGSDATGSRPALAAARPRVRAPVSGTRIALDPDVPPERQRLLLEAEHVTGSPRWRMDGIDLGAADARRLWEPVPGRHLLELVDAAGEPQDRVEFEVRGRTGH